MADVVLKQVEKFFGTSHIIRGVDLAVRSGEFCVFVGPSGCGKSTLLRLVAGLEDISAGEIWIGGDRVNDKPPKDRGIAMVFQSYALYPHMTVEENMAFGLKLAGSTRAERKARVLEAARILKIDHRLHRKPRQLSGGQRQRVALGRAIVREPNVFLLDEPLSNLDAALRVEMRLEIAKLHRRLGATLIYVTHDQVEAMTLADNIVVINQGLIEQAGPPMDLYHAPVNRFVAGFIGSPMMNFLPAQPVGGDRDHLLLQLASGATITARRPQRDVGNEALTLGVRPEHLSLVDQGGLPGVAVDIEKMGAESTIHMDVGSLGPLVVKVHGETRVRVGDPVQAAVPAQATYLFDHEGRSIGPPVGPFGERSMPVAIDALSAGTR